MTTELTWTGSPDDQTCRIGDYVLRVQVWTLYTMWKVYHKDHYDGRIPLRRAFEISKSEAKTACEKAYREHLKTR